MKSYGRILWLITVLLCVGATTVFALRPSGPGINTKTNSLSVAIATDQPAVAMNDIPSLAEAVTRAEIDAGTAGVQNCKGGLWVETAIDGGLVVVPYNAPDATVALTFGSVGAGRFPLATQRVVTTGTSVGVIKCLNP